MVGTVDTGSRVPEVTLTVTVSPSVPVGSVVDLFVGSTLLGSGRVRNVSGKDEVSFNVVFYEAGTYVFTAEYMGSGSDAASTSNTVTVTVEPANSDQRLFRDTLVAAAPPGTKLNPLFGGWYGW